jgi:zinc protease
MSARAVSDATFGQEVLKSTTPVLVCFTADWCRPCRDMAPALDEVAGALEGKVKVVKVDADRELIVKGDYKVHGLPAMILFKSGKPVARRIGALVRRESLEDWVNAALIFALATQTISTSPRATEFALSNGMDVVVIPDRRAPIVTHMVWYKVGAADEPEGVSGIARFLEHLTFKSMDKIEVGQFSKTIERLGGQNNAFSGQDYTAYVERVSKDRLKTAMEMEAERMNRLRLTEEAVATERQVVMEQRRIIDSSPDARLSEQMNAALYQTHPYGDPVVGWANEVANLSRKDAMSFYKHHYAPNNAVLVVSGDVTPEEVERLAELTYGKIPPNRDLEERERPQEPPHHDARRITLKDARVGAAAFRRTYIVPSYVTAKPGEAEALEILARILANGSTSRLNRKLVDEDELAATTGGYYFGSAVDSGRILIGAVAGNGNLRALEASVDAILDDIRSNGVTQLEFSRAKKSLLASYIYDCDNQQRLASRYGLAVAIGRTIDQVEGWPAAIAKVTIDDIKAVANEYLDPRRSVTGWLLPEGWNDDLRTNLEESDPAQS